MDITTKKGRRGRKDIDRIIVEKGRRGDFSPLQPDHYHSFYEIFYLWSGSCRFLLKDTVYQLEAGDLVFIAPGELHHSLYSAALSKRRPHQTKLHVLQPFRNFCFIRSSAHLSKSSNAGIGGKKSFLYAADILKIIECKTV